MKLKLNKIFTYPVLCYNNDDYINSTFTFGVKAERLKKKAIFSCTVYLNEKNLENLIADGKCKMYIHVECTKTSFRHIYEFDNNLGSLSIDIETKMLNGNVSLNAFVIAHQNLYNFQSEDFNEDLKGFCYTIEQGAILAIDDTKYVFIEKNNQELLSIPSAINITSHPDEDDLNFQFDFNKERIFIYLNKADFRNYRSLLGYDEDTPTYHQMIVFPVVVEAIKLIIEGDEIYSHLRWYKSISKALLDKGIDLTVKKYNNYENAYLYAQKILGNSLSRSLRNICIKRESGREGS